MKSLLYSDNILISLKQRCTEYMYTAASNTTSDWDQFSLSLIINVTMHVLYHICYLPPCGGPGIELLLFNN